MYWRNLLLLNIYPIFLFLFNFLLKKSNFFSIFASAVILAYGLGVVPSLHTQKELSKKMIYGVFLSGMLLKMILAAVSRGYESDFNCFSVWADMVFHGGFSAFYRSEAFTDYPPGYMYILWVIGFFKNILPASEPLLRVLIKLPAILADLFSALLIFRLGGKKRPSFFLAACYLLNPAVVLILLFGDRWILC